MTGKTMSPASREFEVTQEVIVRAIHSLVHPDLTAAENEALYGRCYRQHGHHYRIQVTLKGPLDEQTGLVFDRDRLTRILNAAVSDPLDGQDLNQIFPNTSCEAVARAIFLRLRPLFPDGLLKRINIQETNKNYFEFPPAAGVCAGTAGTTLTGDAEGTGAVTADEA